MEKRKEKKIMGGRLGRGRESRKDKSPLGWDGMREDERKRRRWRMDGWE
jgi:hypothetical protein